MKSKFIIVFALITLSIGSAFAMGGKPSEPAPERPAQYLVSNEAGGFTIYPTNDRSYQTVKHNVPGMPELYDNTYYTKDTTNIEYALNKAAPGSTVQLAAGTFYVSKCIVAYNFEGFFKGSGRESTIIVTAGHPREGEIVFPLLTRKESPTGQRAPSVFWFLESETGGKPTRLNMSGMTIKVETDTEETVIGAPWKIPGISLANILCVTGRKPLWGIHDNKGNYVGLDKESRKVPQANVSISEVNFEGGYLSGSDIPNVGMGVSIFGGFDMTVDVEGQEYEWYAVKPLNGAVNISECTFTNTRLGGIWISGLVSEGFESTVWSYPSEAVEATVNIEGNEFLNTGFGAHWASVSLMDCDVEGRIGANRFNRCAGGAVYLSGGYVRSVRKQLWYPVARSNYKVQNNQISLVPWKLTPIYDGLDGIVLADFSNRAIGTKSLDIDISGNNIDASGFYWGAIFGYGAGEVSVSNNRIAGNAVFPAIYMGVGGDTCTNWNLKDNELHAFKSSINVPLWLGAGTRGCYVMGDGFEVFNQGVNNSLSGVNGIDVHIGPEIEEALQHRLEKFIN